MELDREAMNAKITRPTDKPNVIEIHMSALVSLYTGVAVAKCYQSDLLVLADLTGIWTGKNPTGQLDFLKEYTESDDPKEWCAKLQEAYGEWVPFYRNRSIEERIHDKEFNALLFEYSESFDLKLDAAVGIAEYLTRNESLPE